MASSLQILADENIPHADDAFGTLGTVRTMPGRALSASNVRGVDVLLVRSVTPIGPDLLEESGVRFVGSATIGTDHVDQDFLDAENIAFAHAPASNADSVADYVVATLLLLAVRTQTPLQGQTVGIVGCGNIGGRLTRRLPALGLEVLANDPPRAEEAEARGEAHDFVSLEHVLQGADIVTLHVPLTREGPHATHHLVDADALAALREGAWLVNTSRGAVVDPAALRDALDAGRLGALALDVWADEPTPDPVLVRQADVATPHIAGYAYDGKVRGTAMLYNALCEHLGVTPTWDPQSVLAPMSPDALRCTPPDPRLPLPDRAHHLARQACDVAADDARFRPYLDLSAEERGAFFSELRKTYPTRREMQQHTVPAFGVSSGHRTLVRDGLTMGG